MTREGAERIVRDVMYGAPGEDWDTPDGRRLLIGVLEQMGLSALTDAAVIRLAAEHQAEDERQASRALPGEPLGSTRGARA